VAQRHGDRVTEQVITPRVELYLGGAWVDVSGDVVSSVKADWGIHGSGLKDRVADPGAMSFDLDNSAQNSGGVRGYYSPTSPSVRVGFGIGTPARLVLQHALYGTRVKWVGTIESARPVPGARDPKTAVSCVDWMDEAARAKLSGIAVQTDAQSDALFNVLVAAMDRQPPGGIMSGSGSDVYPYALDDAQDEASKVTALLQRLALSEYGLVYVSAGVLVFEGRRRRGGAGGVRFAMDDDGVITALGVTHGRDDVVNRVQVSIHPRRRDAAATTVLFNLGSAVEVLRNTSVVVTCPYRDPNQQAQRVGGIDMVAPVATTDYLLNTAADGSGTNITAQLVVSAAYGGNSATLTLTNNGPLDGHVTKLQLRGRGLYDFEPLISDIRDAASVTAYGENSLSYDMPYQASLANALDTGQFILALNRDERTRATTVSYVANWDLSTVEQCFNLEISDRVSITSLDVGLDGAVHFVNGVRLEVRMSGVVVVTYDLGPVDTSQYWLLEVPGRTELDQTTTLGYGLFVGGWLLDTSVVGTDSFLV
jgi:hypothetical protein